MERELTISHPHPHTPQPAIWHLLLWIAGAAVIAGWRGSSLTLASAAWSMQVFQVAGLLSYYMLAGLALAGFTLAIGCAIRGRHYYPLTSGHWLLTSNGLIVLCSEAGNWITNAWHRTHPQLDQLDVAHPGPARIR